jgi:superfamily I DNA/RNA helicase
MVDEFQDLTPGEQELMFRLRRHGGQLVALGDPRKSIYRFRGNDRQGLAKLEKLVGEGGVVTDVPLKQCQRCPSQIVVAEPTYGAVRRRGDGSSQRGRS